MGFCHRDGLRFNDRYGTPTGRDLELPPVLLVHGGDEVVWVPTEAYLVARLLDAPVVSDGASARLEQGEPSRCHSNVAERVAGGTAERIHTGWALSDDGLWRNHSWTVTDDGEVVETTVLRVRYVGAALDDVETFLFVAGEGFGDELVASDAVRWLPVVDRLLAVAEEGVPVDGSVWALAARLRRR